MWMHVSETEKQLSVHQHENDNQNLPATDDTTIPGTPKTKADPAPVRPGAEDDEDEDENVEPGPELEPEAESEPVSQPENGPPSSARKRTANTTSFAFWPDPADMNDTLPNIEDSDDNDQGEEREAKRHKRWLGAGLSYPEKEAEGGTWHGAHFLGEGSTGRVGLWIRVSATKLVNDVRARTS